MREAGCSGNRANTSASQARGSTSLSLQVYAAPRTMPNSDVLDGRTSSDLASVAMFGSRLARHSRQRSKGVQERKKLIIRSKSIGHFAAVRLELGQRGLLQCKVGM